MQTRSAAIRILGFPLLAITALAVAPPSLRLNAALLSSAVYGLMPALLPQCRLDTDRYLCPLNWAMFLFFLKLVLLPVLVMIDVPAQGVLLGLPERSAMEYALLMETVAFVAFCLAIRFIAVYGRRQGVGAFLASLLERVPPTRMLIVYAVLGVFGFVGAFGSLGTLRAYFADPAILPQLSEQLSGTWRGLFGTVLRPFLAFALIMYWCRTVDERTGSGLRRLLVGVFVACGVTLANLTFGFNRASFVFPLMSLMAVFNFKVRRVSPAVLAALAAVALIPLLAVGAYRSGAVTAEEVMRDDRMVSQNTLSEQLQVYGCAPQFLAFFLEKTGWGNRMYWGSTIIASALHPIPLIGKSFRDSSGVAIYNRSIYGNAGVEDQIVPFQGELFINFHLAGIVAGFFALGLLIGELQRRFLSAGSAFAAFSLHYVASWAAMLVLWSVAVFSQIMFYFCWPIHAFALLTVLRRWAARQGRVPAASRLSAAGNAAGGLS